MLVENLNNLSGVPGNLRGVDKPFSDHHSEDQIRFQEFRYLHESLLEQTLRKGIPSGGSVRKRRVRHLWDGVDAQTGGTLELISGLINKANQVNRPSKQNNKKTEKYRQVNIIIPNYMSFVVGLERFN